MKQLALISLVVSVLFLIYYEQTFIGQEKGSTELLMKRIKELELLNQELAGNITIISQLMAQNRTVVRDQIQPTTHILISNSGMLNQTLMLAPRNLIAYLETRLWFLSLLEEFESVINWNESWIETTSSAPKNSGIYQSNDWTQRWNTCAIVANGDTLLRKHFGEEIDSHENIIRFNDYKLGQPSYEYTGRRTTISAVNRFWTNLDPRRTELGSLGLACEYPKQLTKRPLDWRQKWRNISFNWRRNLDKTLPLAWKKVSSQPLAKYKEPTSGMIVIFWFLSKCETMNLYGYNPFPEVPTRMYGHYWENKQMKVWEGHPFFFERILLHALTIKYEGKINIKR